jgi:hypothetical protein
VWPKPQHEIDRLAEATIGVHQESQQIITRRRLDDSLANPHNSTIRETPIHPDDVVAEFSKS